MPCDTPHQSHEPVLELDVQHLDAVPCDMEDALAYRQHSRFAVLAALMHFRASVASDVVDHDEYVGSHQVDARALHLYE